MPRDPAPRVKAPPARNDFVAQPGYLFRRGQQICISAFYDALGPDITPIQYAVMREVRANPGMDQVTVAKVLALDSSTTAEVAARLERKGLLRRELQIVMRRQRLLHLTAEGESVLERIDQGAARISHDVLGRLEPQEQNDLMRLLLRFVEVNTPPGEPGGIDRKVVAKKTAAIRSR